MAADDTGAGRANDQQELSAAARADLHLKIGTEYALRARHNDVVRATIDVGLVTFTSLSFVLYAAIYDRTDANIYVLLAISVLVMTLGLFGIAFSFGRELSIRRWLVASDDSFERAARSAGIEGERLTRQRRPDAITWLVYLLMSVAMVGPGLILLYATLDLIR